MRFFVKINICERLKNQKEKQRVIFYLISSLELAHEYNMCMLTTTH